MAGGPISYWNPYKRVDAGVGDKIKSMHLNFIINNQLPKLLKRATIPTFLLNSTTKSLSDVLKKFPNTDALKNKISQLFGSKIERLLFDADQNRFKSGRKLLAIVDKNFGRDMKLEVCRYVLRSENLKSKDTDQLIMLADIMKLFDSIKEKLSLTKFAVQMLSGDLSQAATFIRMLDAEDFKDMAPRLLLFASAITLQNDRAGSPSEKVSELWEKLIHNKRTT